MKKFKSFQLKNIPLWLRGGLLGVALCIFLFLFYMFVYFPLIDRMYKTDYYTYNTLPPAWSTTIPLITGHLFPLFSGYSTPVELFCKSTEPICIHWRAQELVPETTKCIPWEDPSGGKGVPGCCLDLQKVPSPLCREKAEKIWSWSLVITLFIIYFMIGAVIGRIMNNRKKIKKIKH